MCGLVGVAVQRVGDEGYGDSRLKTVVDQSPEPRHGARYCRWTARQHAVNVETDAERRLYYTGSSIYHAWYNISLAAATSYSSAAN